MQVNLGLKMPGFSAFVVLGLGVGALLNKDFGNAAITFVVVALDVFRVERAQKAAKQGEKANG